MVDLEDLEDLEALEDQEDQGDPAAQEGPVGLMEALADPEVLDHQAALGGTQERVINTQEGITEAGKDHHHRHHHHPLDGMVDTMETIVEAEVHNDAVERQPHLCGCGAITSSPYYADCWTPSTIKWVMNHPQTSILRYLLARYRYPPSTMALTR